MVNGRLSHRQLQAEVMDGPNLPTKPHRHALEGLSRINYLSRTVSTLWPHLRHLAGRVGRPLRVLDVACGGGDVAIGLWRKACRADVGIEIRGIDLSPTAVDHARQRARSTGASIRFDQLDALRDSLPQEYDATICSLFLHHLDEREAMCLLAKMAATGSRLLLVNDLRRCCAGYVLAHLACRMLTTSPIVHVDGPRSVAGAFQEHELAEVFRGAGLDGATIERIWPFRMLGIWRQP